MPMKKLGKSAMTALVISALFVFLGLSGCQKKEGPGERVGKQIDKTLEKAGQQMEKAGEKMEDTAKDANKK
jgi:PBP1b-binding outer membrane lipoprotein LpoB